MWKIRSEATTTKEKETKQKIPEKEEDKINRKLTEANQYWNDWKFQIHWNKIEWVNPRSHDGKNPFWVSSLKML